jgi:hypothetical protein
LVCRRKELEQINECISQALVVEEPNQFVFCLPFFACLDPSTDAFKDNPNKQKKRGKEANPVILCARRILATFRFTLGGGGRINWLASQMDFRNIDGCRLIWSFDGCI